MQQLSVQALEATPTRWLQRCEPVLQRTIGGVCQQGELYPQLTVKYLPPNQERNPVLQPICSCIHFETSQCSRSVNVGSVKAVLKSTKDKQANRKLFQHNHPWYEYKALPKTFQSCPTIQLWRTKFEQNPIRPGNPYEFAPQPHSLWGIRSANWHRLSLGQVSVKRSHLVACNKVSMAYHSECGCDADGI